MLIGVQNTVSEKKTAVIVVMLERISAGKPYTRKEKKLHEVFLLKTAG